MYLLAILPISVFVVLSSKSAADVLIRLATFQVFVAQDSTYLSSHLQSKPEHEKIWRRNLAPYVKEGIDKHVKGRIENRELALRALAEARRRRGDNTIVV